MKDIKTENLPHLNDYIDIGIKVPPIHTDTIDGVLQPKAFRVVTNDLKSLGLRNNPNILQYEKGAWKKLPESEQYPGRSDWGGIWIHRTISQAKATQRYMAKRYNQTTQIFKATFDDILGFNGYRIKTNAMLLYEERS